MIHLVFLPTIAILALGAVASGYGAVAVLMLVAFIGFVAID